eukprot:g3353.t1
MSLQGLPDPHIVDARAEKKRVLAEQKAALDALERRQNQSSGGAGITKSKIGQGSSLPNNKAHKFYQISVDDELAKEDELDVYAMEAEMQDNKFWFIQEAQLNAKGIGSTGKMRNAGSSLEEQLREQMGLQKKNDKIDDGKNEDGDRLATKMWNDDYYDNFKDEVIDAKWGVVGKNPPPPIQIGGVNKADDLNLFECRARICKIIARTKPWIDGLIDSFTPYLDELYALSEEIELKEYMSAFLHDEEASTTTASVAKDSVKTDSGLKTEEKNNNFDLSLEGLARRVDRYIALADAVVNHASHIEHIPCGISVIYVEECKQAIRQRALELADVLLNGCKQRLMGVCTTLDAEYSSIEVKVKRAPTTSQELFDHRVYMKNVENVELPRLGKKSCGQYLYIREACYGRRVTTLIGKDLIREMDDLGQRIKEWRASDRLKDSYNLLGALECATSEIECFKQDHAVLLEMLATDGLESRAWWDTMASAIIDGGGSLGRPEDDSSKTYGSQLDSSTVLGEVFDDGFLNMANLLDLRLHEYIDVIAPICHRLAMFGPSIKGDDLSSLKGSTIAKSFSELDKDFMSMQREAMDISTSVAKGPEGEVHADAEDNEKVMHSGEDSPNGNILTPTLSVLGGIISLKRLSTLRSRLEFIKWNLQNEVEVRCGEFPRLWLLSKNQIFKLMVDSRSRQEIQRHIPLLFPGMSGILFGSGEDDEQSTAGYIDAGDITGIFCDDGEMIGLAKRQTSELVGMRQHMRKMLSPNVVNDKVAFNKLLNAGAYINPERQRSPLQLWLRQLETEMRRAEPSAERSNIKLDKSLATSGSSIGLGNSLDTKR